MALDDIGLAPEASPTPEDATVNFGDLSLSPDQADRITTFLHDEITRAEGETRDFRERVVQWREFIDPRDRQKNFPWPGASNVFVPIPRIVLDSLKASIKQSVTKQRKLWSAEIVSAEAAGLENDQQIFDAERAVEDFAEKVSVEPGFLELKKLIDEWIEELLVTGIGPVKLIIENNQPNIVTKSGERVVVISAGPRLFVVPVNAWVWPAGAWRSVQDMPWAGDWVEHTPSALRLRADPPWNYQNVEEVITGAGDGTQVQSPAESQVNETLGQHPTSRFKTYEVAMLWDIEGNGQLHDIVVTYNLEANLIHRVIYNQADDGLKPYEVEVASTRTGTIFGRGIIEPMVQPVRAINTAINQTFDSQTLANAPSILYPEDSEAARILQDGFFVGMPLPYKESKDEVGVLQFPSPSAASFQLVQFFMTIIERLTRVGPSRLGEVSTGKRTPASLGLATQQIGAELIDEIIDRFRETMGRLMGRALMLYHEDDPGIFERLLGERGVILRNMVEKAKVERRTVFESLRMRLSASSATRSVELERQNTLATAQFLFGWYRQAIELVQMTVKGGPAGPPTPEERGILIDILKSSQEMMKRIVELSDQPDSATLVPDMAMKLEEAISGGPPEATPPELPPELAGAAPTEDITGGLPL